MSEMISTRVHLPRDTVDLLRRRGKVWGVTIDHQIREALAAYVARTEELDKDDPILRADDPIFHTAGAISSGVGDLAVHHDQYLYHKEWQERSEEGIAE